MKSRKNPTSILPKVRVGLTVGDPSGIGPAITLKAIAELGDFVEFSVISDAWVLKKAQGLLPVRQAEKLKALNFKLFDLNNVDHRNFSFGKIRAEYGRASVDYLDKALDFIRAKMIDCLVTCPISKEAINLAGIRYSGHTEYFSKQLNCNNAVMMLLNKYLKFSLVTRHIPLKNVALKLDQEGICTVIKITYSALKKLFAMANPRIAVCALNPHASDNGLIGSEEKSIISPALKRIKSSSGISAVLLPADIAIKKALLKEYDCLIALYHDQALIPLKLSGQDSGVNLTLGLPFIRTSALHGTAFDIAANPKAADPDSLIAAIKLAVRCTQNLKKA